MFGETRRINTEKVKKEELTWMSGETRRIDVDLW